MTDHQIIGKTGRVTGRIAPGKIGEVMVTVRGGAEAFYARSVEPGVQIDVGERIVVIDHQPPRTVFVSRFD